jgi:hypothetical protein
MPMNVNPMMLLSSAIACPQNGQGAPDMNSATECPFPLKDCSVAKPLDIARWQR